jgi:sterol desaturase/sphingolipid hydroxylase (fatty acid hydroxylase superfamily)
MRWDELEIARWQSARQPARTSSHGTAARYAALAPEIRRAQVARMYERRDQKPLSRRRFAMRMVRHAGAATLLVIGSLIVGMVGYHWFAEFSWIDAFVNASMLLGGMGPVGDLTTRSGKLFAGFFALYSGMVFLVLVATILTPVIHRVLHRFHWEMDQKRAAERRTQ